MPPQVYSFYKDAAGTYRPMIPIRLTNPETKQSIMVMALLDTGADECVLPQMCCDKTGHNLKGEGVVTKVNQGVGANQVSVWKHTFIIEIFSPDKRSIVWKSKPQLISCLDHEQAPPLLGWSGCMEFFNIRFNYPTKKIVIEFSK